MRQSGNKNGYTRVDHVTFDLILPMLSTAAQSVFLRIYRQTWGWNKQTDNISHTQFKKWCKIKSHITINAALDELKELDLIRIQNNGTHTKKFGLNVAGIDAIRQRHLESLERDE